MTSKQRYLATLRGEQPDTVARIPILMQFAAEYIGSNYGAFASDHRVLVEANIRCAEDFGMDQLSAISDPYRETAGFGAPIEFRKDGVPVCLRHPLEENPDLENLPHPDPRVAPRMKDRIDALRLYKERTGDEYSLLGWVEGPAAEAADLRGVSNFLMDLMTMPEYTQALMSRCVETAVRFAEAQIEAGADTIGIGDAIASQVSAETYEELILPMQRELVSAIRKRGAFVRLHICGNISHLLKGISTLGIDILDIDHPVNLAEARGILGPKVVLAGNLNPVACVMQGTERQIEEAVLRCQCESGMPFMINAGCEIPARTPVANLKVLCRRIAPSGR